ncbi:MAG: hypothetical protein QW587_04620 [Candidatus Bathyarchaeia archaeon]
MLDLSRVDKVQVKENYLIALGFRDGFVFLRSSSREHFTYLYDPFYEITDFAGAGATSMAAGQWIAGRRLGSITLNRDNVLEQDNKEHLYEVYTAMSPAELFIYPYVPIETQINNLDIANWSSAYPWFGFWRGGDSPIDYPSPDTRLFIPEDLVVGFGFYNSGPNPIKPLLQFYINRLKITPIRDVDLIQKIIERRVECTWATVGGIEGAPYDPRSHWDVDAIKLDADRARIAAAVRKG